MGNRDDLIAAAKICLKEKGYSRTTARDIASKANVSLAAIGYHFGSKEALLSEALISAMVDWTVELDGRLRTEINTETRSVERFETVWSQMMGSFEENRMLLLANFEISTEIEKTPEVRTAFADAMRRAQLGLVRLFQNGEPKDDDRSARMIGSLYYSMFVGVIVQWLIDPDGTPSGHDLMEALRKVVDGFGPTVGREHVPIDGDPKSPP